MNLNDYERAVIDAAKFVCEGELSLINLRSMKDAVTALISYEAELPKSTIFVDGKGWIKAPVDIRADLQNAQKYTSGDRMQESAGLLPAIGITVSDIE